MKMQRNDLEKPQNIRLVCIVMRNRSTGKCDPVCQLEIAPEIPRCADLGSEQGNLDLISKTLRWQAAKLQFTKSSLSRELIDKAHEHGIRCNLCCCDDPQEAEKYLADGIDTILPHDFWQIAQVVHAGNRN